nr:DUF1810 family protein [Polaromonas sp. C04]
MNLHRHKTSHWMSFIFPWLRELGRSIIGKHSSFSSREEAPSGAARIAKMRSYFNEIGKRN